VLAGCFRWPDGHVIIAPTRQRHQFERMVALLGAREEGKGPERYITNAGQRRNAPP